MSHDPALRTEEYQVSPPRVEGTTVDEATGPYTPDSVAEQHPGDATPAIQIPGYIIEREIARGGMGRVLAGRELAMDREVAIKTLLPGADPTRFVTEAKITARLPHPSIPPVHALGTLADGTPYLAMKLVRGQTLAEQLKGRPQPLHDLPRFLQIFEQIAQAVGFAHAQGILHRDLKPANVMVGAFGEVQVMDWGLAKQLQIDDRELPIDNSSVNHQSAITNHQFETHAGAVLGTPNYMAPEQARGESATPTSDVFALGGILCSILTGKPVFGGATAPEIVQRAAAGDTTDALARLEASGADPEVIALARRCLALSPADRPADGQAVAAEVATYRAGVEARLRQAETERAEAVVREGEQRKRRRVVQWSGSIIAVVLLVGTTVSLWQMVRANRERDDKAEALQAEQKAKEQAQKGVELLAGIMTGINPRAEEKGGEPVYAQLRQKAEAAAAQLQGEAVGDPLAMARLQTILGNTLRELGSYPDAVALLEKARATRERLLGANHPDTLHTLGRLASVYKYQGVERLPEAIRLFERIRAALMAQLGEDHPETLVVLNNLALAYLEAGRHAEGIRVLEQVRDGKVARLKADHPETLTTLHNLATAYRLVGRVPEAVHLLEQVRTARVAALGADHTDTLTTVNQLGMAYLDAGRLPEAIGLLEQARDTQRAKLGADHPDTLDTLDHLAKAYMDDGKLPEAIRLLEQVRTARVAVLGADAPATLKTLRNLATAYQAAGRMPEAIRLFEQVHNTSRATLGADHPDTLAILNNLAVAHLNANRMADAIRILEQLRSAQADRLEPDHHDTLSTLHNLGSAYRVVGRLSEAVRLLEQVSAARAAKLGFDNPDTLATLTELAQVYQATGKLSEAIRLQEQVRDVLTARLGADHPDTLSARNSLAKAHNAAGSLTEAIRLWEELRQPLTAQLGANHPHTLVTLYNLARVYQRAGKRDQALPLLVEAAAGLEKHQFKAPFARSVLTDVSDAYEATEQWDKAAFWRRKWLAASKPPAGAESPAYAGDLTALGTNLLRQKQWSDAEPVLRESLALRAKSQPDAWSTFNTQSLLGAALLGQKKYADAEPLLLKGYEGMKAREKTIPKGGEVRLPEALDRLIELYTLTNKPDEVMKWQAERAKYYDPKPPEKK